MVVVLGEMVREEPALTRALLLGLAAHAKGHPHQAGGQLGGGTLAEQGLTIEQLVQRESESGYTRPRSELHRQPRFLTPRIGRILLRSKARLKRIAHRPGGTYAQMDFATRDWCPA
jgi:hypothetical protein